MDLLGLKDASEILSKDGVKVNIILDTKTLFQLGAVIFIAGALIVLAYRLAQTIK